MYNELMVQIIENLVMTTDQETIINVKEMSLALSMHLVKLGFGDYPQTVLVESLIEATNRQKRRQAE